MVKKRKQKSVTFELEDWQKIGAAAPDDLTPAQFIRKIISENVPGFQARKHGGNRTSKADKQ